MRVTIKELLEKLAVDRVLHSYETQPWYVYDEARGITCSAEVRMGPAADEVEAEIQFVHDEKQTEEDGGSADGSGGGPEQIFRMKALPVGDNKWAPKELFVKGEDYNNKIPKWEEKGCNFFFACVSSINIGEIPDVDAIKAREMKDDTQTGKGKRGRIGRKSPKADQAAMLGMKKGM